MTFLLKIREAARQCSNIDYRHQMFAAADRVENAIKELRVEPTEENMRALVGAWANAERIYDNMPSEGNPAPLAGTPEAARLAA